MARLCLFDLGRVVLDWEPARLYDQMFDDPGERDWFLENVCTMTWHSRHDAGAPFAETRGDLIERFPEYEAAIRAWGDRWMEMFDGCIEGTPEILQRLAARATPLFALSNMPAEVWPTLQTAFPVLSIFEDVVVSGAEGVIKPNPEIFAVALRRMGAPSAADVFFVDDSERNIAAAADLGFDTHLFECAVALEAALVERGLL